MNKTLFLIYKNKFKTFNNSTRENCSHSLKKLSYISLYYIMSEVFKKIRGPKSFASFKSEALIIADYTSSFFKKSKLLLLLLLILVNLPREIGAISIINETKF